MAQETHKPIDELDFDKLLSSPNIEFDDETKEFDSINIGNTELADEEEEEEVEELFTDDAKPSKRVVAPTPPETHEQGDARIQIAAQAQEIAELKSIIKSLNDWKSGIEKSAVENTLSNLESQRRSAMVNGDMQLALDLEDQISAYKQQIAAEQQKSTPQIPPVDLLDQRVDHFVNSHKAALEGKVKALLTLNGIDEKTPELKRAALLQTLTLVVKQGVQTGSSVDDIIKTFADAANLRTNKPVKRTNGANLTASASNVEGVGDLKARFKALPKEARDLWLKGGYDRIYGGDLKAYITETERSYSND